MGLTLMLRKEGIADKMRDTRLESPGAHLAVTGSSDELIKNGGILSIDLPPSNVLKKLRGKPAPASQAPIKSVSRLLSP